MTCIINCDLILEEKMYYGCQQCFKYFCAHCYSCGVHQEHDDSLSINLDASCSGSDSESESLESSYCSTEENGFIGVT